MQLDAENNLGEVYRLRGDPRSAERMYEGSLGSRQSGHGLRARRLHT